MKFLDKLKAFLLNEKDRPYMDERKKETAREDYCLEESRKPELLKKLERYQIEGLADWDDLGFAVCYGTDPDTPLDGILFAGTGGNRIHFAFLTDFGQITDLSEAPIICVAPTYDPSVNLVAQNLRQFLSFVAYLQDAEILADIYASEADLEEERLHFLSSYNEPERVAAREKALEILKSEFDIHPDPNVFDTIRIAKAERAQQVQSTTIEGLGIILPNDESITELAQTKDLQKVKTFLASTNLNSRIKFYREATYLYILSKGYDEEIRDLLLEYLEKDGFTKEARRLRCSS